MVRSRTKCEFPGWLRGCDCASRLRRGREQQESSLFTLNLSDLGSNCVAVKREQEKRVMGHKNEHEVRLVL